MGHDVHIVTYSFGDDLPVGGAKLHRIPHWGKARSKYVGPSKEKPFLDALMVAELLKVIRREKIDIIHAHNYEGALVGIAAKLVTGKPLIYNAVNLMSDELHTYGFIKPEFLAKGIARALDWFVPILPDHILTLTPELNDALIKKGVKPERLTIVPCGVKPEMFDNADPTKFRRQYPVEGRKVVMYTGINSAFQRVDYLLRAFTVVLKEEPNSVLMVVSPMERHQEPDLIVNQQLAEQLGISKNVIWVGPHTLDDLPHYLALADVTVVPRPECPGHPIKLLNYMMASRPIVCFQGAAKGIEHMRDALIVPDHNWQQMGKDIVTLIRDREVAARLGARAKETVLENFDWRILCKRVEGIYDRLLNGHEGMQSLPIGATQSVLHKR
jgi:glycosyltransferase involved in cell wall biosynthesis